MKLYNVPRNTHIKITDDGETILFHHIDGAYSLCTTESGSTTHLPAYTEVTIVPSKE